MKNNSKKYIPYILITPVLLVILLLYAYPILMILIQSFNKVSIVDNNYTFIGLDNFTNFFNDGTFRFTLLLTLKYTVITVTLKLIIGFSMALVLNSETYFNRTLRFLTLIPWTIQQVSVAVIWKWIFDGNYGYLNYILLKLGLIEKNILWLSDPKLALISASIVDTWLGISFVSMIFLAALNSIDKSLYESSKIDGANSIQSFRHITIPSIKKVFIITGTLVSIWTFNSFNVIYVLTRGGPMRKTETFVIRIYQEAFEKFNIGSSSAISVIVFLLLLLLTVVYIKLIFNKDGENLQ
ncbi:sugar ABC transporter permease [Peptostreptococcus porci]|uniref:carbohydrate ABC transporter permease n=1 Tax=Peptostreptococcus porci TaxID=2652282 RepID=UPI002A818C60|nr:sugar ABC transporter permease [Peptostreptococcus porci]MDY4127497.1 sugar ABC transporter permease [Peptostreptococcus porci]MDY5964790.1 sugar ABC transporter permease [Peptostreptococcus porci]